MKLCRRILRALASNSQPQQQEREAVTLLKASLDPETLLTTSSMQDFEACLDTVLFHSHRLLPATVTSLLGCFDLSQYASRLLEEQPKEATQVEVEGSGWSREDTAKVSEKAVTHSAALSLCMASAELHVVPCLLFPCLGRSTHTDGSCCEQGISGCCQASTSLPATFLPQASSASLSPSIAC